MTPPDRRRGPEAFFRDVKASDKDGWQTASSDIGGVANHFMISPRALSWEAARSGRRCLPPADTYEGS